MSLDLGLTVQCLSFAHCGCCDVAQLPMLEEQWRRLLLTSRAVAASSVPLL